MARERNTKQQVEDEPTFCAVSGKADLMTALPHLPQPLGRDENESPAHVRAGLRRAIRATPLEHSRLWFNQRTYSTIAWVFEQLECPKWKPRQNVEAGVNQTPTASFARAKWEVLNYGTVPSNTVLW